MGACLGKPKTDEATQPAAAAASGAPEADKGASAPAKSALEPKKSIANLTSNVLGRESENLKDLFTLGRELGRGQFGVTTLCTEKATGKPWACKTIAKRKLLSQEDVDDVKREVAIMHLLSDHDNIVHLQGAYEDKQSVHLVMELCAGGELFDRIIAKGHYSERAAADMIRHIVSIVEYCHANGVIHRDLKPENFLLSDKTENAKVKATDFGLSTFFKPGRGLCWFIGHCCLYPGRFVFVYSSPLVSSRQAIVIPLLPASFYLVTLRALDAAVEGWHA